MMGIVNRQLHFRVFTCRRVGWHGDVVSRDMCPGLRAKSRAGTGEEASTLGRSPLETHMAAYIVITKFRTRNPAKLDLYASK